MLIRKTMIDITDYEVDIGDEHNHKAVIDDIDVYLNIPDRDRLKVYACSRDGDFLLYERISDDMSIMPYVKTSVDNMYYFNYVMKKLYNHTGITISMDDSILACPDLRVNSMMLKEIHDTYHAICREKKIEYVPDILEYMPLSSTITCYKDGVEVPIDVAITGNVAMSLSSVAKVDVAGKKKSLLSKEKKNAICDSILLSEESKATDVSKARELVPMIHIDRSKDMHHFISIGRCLHNIFKGEGEGLDLWISITVLPRHDLCYEYWPTLGTTSTLYTIRYLQYCASKDNPKMYKEWNKSSVRAAIEESVLATGGILDVATAAYRINPTLYVGEGGNWTESVIYKFNGTYYAPADENDMRNYLDKYLIREYKVFLRELAKTVDETPENSVKVMLQSKMDNTIKIISKLKDPAYQLNVVKVMSRLYNIPNFTRLKNSNRDILVFEDCIFDTKLKDIRQGIPEDYMTISTGYTFLEEWKTYSWEHEHVVLVNENMEKIIWEDYKRDWFWDLICKRLKGYNSTKTGLILYGYNNNAKSGIIAWLSKTFGPIYAPDVPSNLLYSEDAHPGAATPHWQLCAYARIINMSEVTDSHMINEGNYKRLTGSTDPIPYRGLYSKKMESFVPACIPITICNSLPKMNGNSAALRNRIVLLHLTATFINENDMEWEVIRDMSDEERSKYMEENHWYCADQSFHIVIEKTYKAFMWIIIQKYIMNGDKSLPIPRPIMEDTVDYFNKSNVYLQFIKQCIRKDEGAKGISTYALFSVYKKWYADNISRYVQITFPTFIQNMASVRVTPINDFYRNITVIYK